MSVLEIMQNNAAKAAGIYKKKCWWASYEDMVQEALVAQLEAHDRGNFDESFGRPLSVYLASVAIYAVRKFVHKSSAPVSTSHRTANLIGLHRSPVELTGEDGSTYQNPALNREESSSERREIAQDRSRRVRTRVVELVGENATVFALTVMTHEWRPAEVAQSGNVLIKDVYRAQRKIAKVLLHDPELLELYRESDE